MEELLDIMMEINPDLRHMIARRSSTDDLRDTAMAAGMKTLRQSARRLVLEGVTTIQEMQRISAGDVSLYEELTPSGGDL